jgi:hypothetical protein
MFRKQRTQIGFLAVSVCCALICGLSISATVEAQSHAITGPFLGFIPDSSGAAISPIVGIPGASILADPMGLNLGIRNSVISPKQNYAIALRGQDARATVIDFTANQLTDIPGAQTSADLISISPTGSAAALYASATSTVQVITSLPQMPQVVGQFDTSAIPGYAKAVSISDDAAFVLMTFVDSGKASVWVLGASGPAWRLPVDSPTAATFLANRRDVIVSDDSTQTTFAVLDIGGAGTQVPVVAGIDGIASVSSLAASEDGARMFLADGTSGNVAIVDLQTGVSSVLQCGCIPSGFFPLKGNSIFRLGNASHDPVMVLDASSAVPRIVVIPPHAPEAQ